MFAQHRHYKDLGNSWTPMEHEHGDAEFPHDHPNHSGWGFQGTLYLTVEIARAAQAKLREEVGMVQQGKEVTTVARALRPFEAAPVAVTEGATAFAEDLRPPIVALVQGTSAKGTKPGWWVRLDTTEEFEALTVVPIRVQAARTKFPAGEFQRDRKPECWSLDGIKGAPGGKYEGSDCARCPALPANPYDADPAQGWCQRGYVVLLYDVANGGVLTLRLQRTSTKAVGPFLAALRKRVVALKTKRVVGERGTWYEPVVEMGSVLDQEQAGYVVSAYEAYRAAILGAWLSSDGEVEEIPVDPEKDARGKAAVQAAIEKSRATDAARDAARSRVIEGQSRPVVQGSQQAQADF